MKYTILLIVSLITALVWHYFKFVYPVPTKKEVLNFNFERSEHKLMIADEVKRVCYVVISFCALLAAIFGASEW